jgi:predicted nucleotidyltransferase
MIPPEHQVLALDLRIEISGVVDWTLGKGRIFTIAVLAKYHNKGISTNLLENICSV